MNNLEHSEPRIIKKKKVTGGHHGGAWKVAYADFVTAMMALFIVLWIMGQSQAVRQSVAQYFKNPGILPGSAGFMETSNMGGEMPTPGHSQNLQTPAPVPATLQQQDQNRLEEAKKHIQELIAQLPDLETLKNQIQMEITDDGLRIQLLEMDQSHFFDIGSANLKPETKKVLSLIAQELNRLPNQLTLEGHTDSRPYGSQNYTNWELSADRANAARRLMEQGGLRDNQVLSVRGFADRHLYNPQNPLDSRNRRVSIIVMFQEKMPSLAAKLPDLQGPGQGGAKTGATKSPEPVSPTADRPPSSPLPEKSQPQPLKPAVPPSDKTPAPVPQPAAPQPPASLPESPRPAAAEKMPLSQDIMEKFDNLGVKTKPVEKPTHQPAPRLPVIPIK